MRNLKTVRKPVHEIDSSKAIENVAGLFKQIMQELKLDLTDDSLRNTPNRVAKMYVQELCSGLYTPPPVCTLFKNKFPRNQIVLERDITVNSMCEHHWLPIVGVCHIAYIPNEHVLGLSKFHRIVDWFSRRPQIQERLTEDIGSFLMTTLKTEDVFVIIKAKHFCCHVRGVKDFRSETITSFIQGSFKKSDARAELLKLLDL